MTLASRKVVCRHVKLRANINGDRNKTSVPGEVTNDCVARQRGKCMLVFIVVILHTIG